MQALLHQIKTYASLTDAAIADIKYSFSELVLAKNEHLITEGKTCRHLYFMEKGAARGYYYPEGKEITHWFSFESDFLTSFHSFITQTPSVENIQLLQGSILWCITKEKIDDLCRNYHEVEKVLRMAYEKYYLRLEERFVNAHFKTAAERYIQLLENSPHILERATLGQIASFLGISQETLSRIRASL